MDTLASHLFLPFNASSTKQQPAAAAADSVRDNVCFANILGIPPRLSHFSPLSPQPTPEGKRARDACTATFAAVIPGAAVRRFAVLAGGEDPKEVCVGSAVALGRSESERVHFSLLTITNQIVGVGG